MGQLLALDTTYIPDGQRRYLKGTDNSYLDLVFNKYMTGVANNINIFRPNNIAATSPGIWKDKESGLDLDQVTQYVYSSIYPNLSTLNDLIRTVDDGIIPLILALGGGGGSGESPTIYPLITVNATTISPDLDISDKYFFNTTGTLSNINNPLNINNGDKFTIQTNNTGVYNFGSSYHLPENYTSVILDGKADIEGTRRGTSTDIIIYSIW